MAPLSCPFGPPYACTDRDLSYLSGFPPPLPGSEPRGVQLRGPRRSPEPSYNFATIVRGSPPSRKGPGGMCLRFFGIRHVCVTSAKDSARRARPEAAPFVLSRRQTLPPRSPLLLKRGAGQGARFSLEHPGRVETFSSRIFPREAPPSLPRSHGNNGSAVLPGGHPFPRFLSRGGPVIALSIFPFRGTFCSHFSLSRAERILTRRLNTSTHERIYRSDFRPTRDAPTPWLGVRGKLPSGFRSALGGLGRKGKCFPGFAGGKPEANSNPPAAMPGSR